MMVFKHTITNTCCCFFFVFFCFLPNLFKLWEAKNICIHILNYNLLDCPCSVVLCGGIYL